MTRFQRIIILLVWCFISETALADPIPGLIKFDVKEALVKPIPYEVWMAPIAGQYYVAAFKRTKAGLEIVNTPSILSKPSMTTDPICVYKENPLGTAEIFQLYNPGQSQAWGYITICDGTRLILARSRDFVHYLWKPFLLIPKS